MKRMSRILVCMLCTLQALSLTAVAQWQHGLQGMWQGTLTAQGMKLRIVFHMEPISGGLRATMDSPDQGAKGIPTDTVIVRGDSVRILMSMVGGQFAGRVEPGDSIIRGTWSQSGMSFDLLLMKTTVAVTHNRPQHPKPPHPYNEEQVAIENPTAKVTLAGTLTTPDGPGPHPAVVLITGSGGQDRDETVFEHKPFLVIADYLTRRGIAVLRCDDRGIGTSTGTMSEATSVDFASDISAAVKWLRTRRNIRRDRIGLIGHSEGAIIASMIASGSPDISFIVLLAGPSIPGSEIIIRQDSLISLANGVPGEDVAADADNNRTLFEISRREPDTMKARLAIEELLLEYARMRNKQERPDSVLHQEVARMARRITQPWMRFFLHYDPIDALRKVRCPILALNGEKDLQVPAEINLQGIERAGREARNPDVTVKLMPGLNHLFQTAKTGSPIEYVSLEETFSPDALAVMGEWITARVK